MVRLFGEMNPNHLTQAERVTYQYLMQSLPDYVSVGFQLEILGREIDAIVIVPHMGVFVLDIRNYHNIRMQGGQLYTDSLTGYTRQINFNRMKESRYLVKQYIRDRFNIDTLVYEIECLPLLELDEKTEELLKSLNILDHVLLRNDFSDRFTVLRKLFQYSEYERERNQYRESHFFVDISDYLASEMAAKWIGVSNETINRPENPPMIFLSYNSNNEERARVIKAKLEKRGIFTWRAPEDVPLGGYYLPEEMHAIKECSVFVLLLSYASQESREVRIEFEAAIEAGKRIFPIIIDPYLEVNAYYKKALEKYQWRILSEQNDSVLDEIVKLIAQHN